MSEKKSLKERISELLKPHNIKLAEDKVEMKMTGKLADGTEILTPAESFAVDAEVFVMGENGEAVPAPDGEHIVDGTLKITVAGGKITASEPVQDEMKEELSAEVSAAINELAQRITALETEKAATGTELAAIKEKLTAAETENATLKSKVTELSKTPGATTVKKAAGTKTELKKEVPTKTWEQMTMVERIQNPEANPLKLSLKN